MKYKNDNPWILKAFGVHFGIAAHRKETPEQMSGDCRRVFVMKKASYFHEQIARISESIP